MPLLVTSLTTMRLFTSSEYKRAETDISFLLLDLLALESNFTNFSPPNSSAWLAVPTKCAVIPRANF